MNVDIFYNNKLALNFISGYLLIKYLEYKHCPDLKDWQCNNNQDSGVTKLLRWQNYLSFWWSNSYVNNFLWYHPPQNLSVRLNNVAPEFPTPRFLLWQWFTTACSRNNSCIYKQTYYDLLTRIIPCGGSPH